ncbi:FG-GAP repeat domain-containing protein [Pseudophaeobacter arcticus]
MIARTMARRLMSRLWFALIRRAWQGALLWPVIALGPSFAAEGMGPNDIGHRPPPPVWPAEVMQADFITPTTRYGHGVLGDAVEWSGLRISFAGPRQPPWAIEIELPADHVFEDLQPRLVDLNLDGRPDAAMVVETDMALGAALALYGVQGKIAETPHIGRANRWLAPVAAGDLDGDGRVELAYVDRPHLAKTLRIWRFEAGTLTPVAAQAGLTNHRIGDDFITSGLRTCADGPELILVDAGWNRLVAARLAAGKISRRDIGPFGAQSSLEAALACQ